MPSWWFLLWGNGVGRRRAAPTVSGLGLPAFGRDGVDHPRHAEPVDQPAVAGRPEGLAERHGGPAPLDEGVEPALRLGLVAGVKADVEAVLGLVDVGRPFDVH